MGVYQQGTPIEISDTFTVDGVETNPTGVVYSVLDPAGTLTTYTWPGAPEIANTSVGNFLLSLSPPTLPGEYHYDVDATGTVVASRAASFTVIPNVSALVDVDWAVQGPCTSWADSNDVWSCCGEPTVTIGEGTLAEICPVDMTQFAFEASQLLYELSGRLYAGMCERKVRPCASRWCGFQVLSRGHIVEDFGWNGISWGNGRTPCGCRALDRVPLSGYPVRSIVQVKIDGAVVDPDTYRLDERRYLTRVRDPADPDTVLLWPSCQHLDLDDTQDGTFSVTYRYGQDPPPLGIHAAAQLGCELYKACTGGDCALPAGATRITRQGVTIERQFFRVDKQVGAWRTGLNLVDAFLNAYNPQGLQRRPSIWAPSGPRYARSVGQ